MRQVIVHVPAGHGARVEEIAERFGGTNLSRTRAEGRDGAPIDLAIVHLSNAKVGPFVGALEAIPEVHVSMIPSGALALRPPASELAEQVRDITPRSPLEVFVAGLQSIGSWKGFLGYAAAAGVVVWLGLYTNTAFLLVGAMLIAPFAGPAMNTAIATARGDLLLLRRSLLRYIIALLVTIAVAALLSLIFRQEVATEDMVAVSNISSAAVLLPLAAGAAGALHLCQGEQSSLVSGAAAGMLIAASLAPPAGLVGMATVTGDFGMLPPAAFLLGLQLVGINLAGTAVFRLFGLKPEGARYDRGRSGILWASLVATVLGVGALLAWQFGSEPPMLQRGALAQRLRGAVLNELARDAEVAVVDASVRFTRASIPGQHTLLVVLYGQRRAGAGASDEELRRRVTAAVQQAITRREPTVEPVVAVSILAPPPAAAR